MGNEEDGGTPAGRGVGWVSALIDESQLAAWVTLGRLYAAMWRELIAGGVPDEVALEILKAQIEGVLGKAKGEADGG